jgi:hypothetical protein
MARLSAILNDDPEPLRFHVGIPTPESVKRLLYHSYTIDNPLTPF